MTADARVRARIVLVAVTALVSMTLGVLVPGALAGHVAPTLVSGNPGCSSLGSFSEIKVEPVRSGSYSDGTLTVTVNVSGRFFSWASDLGIDAVIVKGGPNANVYRYNPEETSDQGLSAPINDRNGEPYGLSHISFCYDVQVASPSPTSPAPTTPGPTSPAPPPPPTVAPTVVPTATPTVSPTVAPTVIIGPTAGPTVTPTVLPTRIERTAQPAPEATPSPTVLGRRVEQAPGQLPLTGAGLAFFAWFGSLLVAAGTSLLLKKRR